MLENEVLKRIGNKHEKSPAQVCLRWLLQRSIVVLPKVISFKDYKTSKLINI